MTFENSSLSELLTPPGDRQPAPLARSEGRAEVTFRADGDISRLSHLYQRGCARVRFPSVDRIEFPEAVLINTAGGLTGGDKVAYDITVGAGARLTVSGQAAEKIYRSVGTTVHIEAELTVGAGATLEWLPQETILFEKSRLRRMNKVHLTESSKFLAVEATVFGREAYGEDLRDVYVRDGWKIWRDGKLIWYDNLALDGDVHAILERPAVMAGARAVATILIADEETEKYLETARAVMDAKHLNAAASCRANLVIIRVLGESAYELRRAMAIIITALRGEMAGKSVPLPRVWENQ